ncbi:CBS-domain-containing protein [Ramicandelaber brevisporus]|nr:CBS-domain-containing protein [Ramicandelaber brevisporus]
MSALSISTDGASSRGHGRKPSFEETLSSPIGRKNLLELSYRDLRIPPSRKPALITATPDATIRSVLSQMASSKVLSLPIRATSDGDPNALVAVVSVTEILLYVTGFGPEKTDHGTADEHHFDVAVAEKRLEHPVSEILKVKESNEDRSVLKVSRTEQLASTIKALSSGLHRALIVDLGDSGSPVTSGQPRPTVMLSQSDVVRYVYEHPTCVPHVDLHKSVADYGLIASKPPVLTVPTSMTAIEALKILAGSKYSALAVVDAADGHIVANLSASDFRGIVYNTIDVLNQSVVEFLHRTSSTFGSSGPVHRTPVVCRKEDHLHHVFTLLYEQKVHRVWVTDAGKRPIGVVTQTDVLRQIVQQQQLSS